MSDDPMNLRGGYTQEELQEAFRTVQSPKGWKFPINKVVPADTDMDRLIFALGYFAGGGADYVETPRGYRVTAPGYYNMIGA